MRSEYETYSIGKVAELCSTPIKTLRYYDEIGLLKPKYRNEDSNYRYYGKEQIHTLLVIRRLRALGFSLKEIQAMISNSDLSLLESMLTEKRTALLSEIKLLRARQETILAMLNRIQLGRAVIQSPHDGEPIPQIEEIPAGRMLYTRQIMKRYCNADTSLYRWTDILEQCTALAIPLKSPIIITFHCPTMDQFLMKDCDVEFGILISEDVALPEIENIRAWGDFTAATIYHVGNYDQIAKTYAAALRWINKHGYQVCGPVSEKFLISPLDVNAEEENVIQIIIPIHSVETGG